MSSPAYCYANNRNHKQQERELTFILYCSAVSSPSRKGIRRSKKSLLLLEGDFHGSPFALMPSAHVIQTHAFRACHPNTRNQRERAFRGQIELSGSWEGIPNTLLRINKTRRQKWEKKKKHGSLIHSSTAMERKTRTNKRKRNTKNPPLNSNFPPTRP